MANKSFKGNIPMDYDGMEDVIDSMAGDCRICNHNKRKKKGNLCSGCCFKSNSSYEYADGTKRTRVYPSQKIFGPFGLVNCQDMGKHHFFHFLENRELDFTYPDLPDIDLWKMISKAKCREVGISQRNGRNFQWHIHHENEKYWDDRACNRLLCLNTEHPKFAKQNKH